MCMIGYQWIVNTLNIFKIFDLSQNKRLVLILGNISKKYNTMHTDWTFLEDFILNKLCLYQTL